MTELAPQQRTMEFEVLETRDTQDLGCRILANPLNVHAVIDRGDGSSWLLTGHAWIRVRAPYKKARLMLQVALAPPLGLIGAEVVTVENIDELVKMWDTFGDHEHTGLKENAE